MKKPKDELPGSKHGGAMTEIAPSIVKKIRKFFRRNWHQHKKLEITNQPGGTINLWLVENTKEEIAQLILECKGNINNTRL